MFMDLTFEIAVGEEIDESIFSNVNHEFRDSLFQFHS